MMENRPSDITGQSNKNKWDMVWKIRSCMQDDWEKVVELYEKEPIAQVTKISKSGYTALHVAVADGKEEIVGKLVKLIIEKKDMRNEAVGKGNENANDPLKMKNQKGNTPLHLAASIGNVKMCKCILNRDSALSSLQRTPNEHHEGGDRETPLILVEIQNEEGETPLFLAALHGKKEAFLYLSYVLSEARTDEQAISSCRRDNGDTVLHCAINGEYFDLAFQIIKLYENLANSVNKDGKSPLHILASKPSAFRSACNFGLWKKMVYICVRVQKLKDVSKYGQTPSESLKDDKKDKNYPENYATSVRCFRFLWELVLVVINRPSAQKGDTENPNTGDEGNKSADHHNEDKKLIPENYTVFYKFSKFLHKAILVFTGRGRDWVIKIQKLKEKHLQSDQVLTELLKCNSLYDFEDAGESPYYDINHDKDDLEALDKAFSEAEHQGTSPKKGKRETALITASRNGITEMVKKIIGKFPMAIYDSNEEEKNVVLVALENRQVEVYKLLLKTHAQNESVFRKVDKDGNGALHIAAMKKELQKSWPIPGDALQLQWEIKLKKFVHRSMPKNFFVRYNKNGETPEEIFTRDHKELVKTGSEWMRSTAESCSVVAALIATVAFATSTALPGGINGNNGKPTMANHPAFKIFAVMSLVALSFSITSLVMFLAILTSRFTEKDFGKVLPWKLLLGLTSLFLGIASMLFSFCAGHFFVLEDSLKVAAFPVYALTCIPISFFAAAQFPLYIDLVLATFGSPFGNPRKLLDPEVNH